MKALSCFQKKIAQPAEEQYIQLRGSQEVMSVLELVSSGQEMGGESSQLSVRNHFMQVSYI